MAKRSDDVLRCSFCNKAQEDVKKLIAGPQVFICNECVDICNDIVAEDEALEAARKAGKGEEEDRERPSAGATPAPRPDPAARRPPARTEGPGVEVTVGEILACFGPLRLLDSMPAEIFLEIFASMIRNVDTR